MHKKEAPLPNNWAFDHTKDAEIDYGKDQNPYEASKTKAGKVKLRIIPRLQQDWVFLLAGISISNICWGIGFLLQNPVVVNKLAEIWAK